MKKDIVNEQDILIKIPKDIEVPKGLQKRVRQYFGKFQRFNKWMLSVDLGILGFFLTILLQIKGESGVPYKYLAIIGLIFPLVSILSGFYFRYRLERYNFESLIRNIIVGSFDLPVTISTIEDSAGELVDIKKDLADKIDKYLKQKQSKFLLKRDQISLLLQFIFLLLELLLFLFILVSISLQYRKLGDKASL